MVFPQRRLLGSKGQRFWRISHDDSYDYHDDALFVEDELGSGSETDSPLPPPKSRSSMKSMRSKMTSRPSSSRYQV